MRLGIGTIRGSGAHNGEFHRKGGAAAFTEMLERAQGGLQRRAHRRRAENRARRRSRRGETGAAFRPADLSGGDRDQPAHRIRQLGQERVQFAVRPAGHGGGRSRFMCRATPTTRRWKQARQEVERELNRATARAYEIVDRGGERDRERQAAGRAARLPAAVGGGGAIGAVVAVAAGQARQGARRTPARAARHCAHRAAAGAAGLAARAPASASLRACCR